MGHGGDDAHAEPSLDEGLDLGLPLLGAHEAGRGQQRQDFLGGGGLAQEAVERAAGRDALAALGGEHEESARLEDARAGAHALHALVKVLVERIAGVGGDHDVEGGVHALHGGLPHEVAPGAVGEEEVAGEHAGDVALVVEGDVEQEAGAHAQGDVPQLLPQGVALANAEGRPGIGEVRGAVVAHHGLHVGHARHDALGTAAEPGEEVRLDEPRHDADVGLDAMPVDPCGDARAGGPERHAGVVAFRLVVQHPVLRHDVGRQHLLQLRPGVGTMRAELVEQGDLVPLDALGFQIGEEPGDQAMVGGGAGNVGEQDDDASARLEPCRQRRAAGGGFEGGNHRRALVGQARTMRWLDDRCVRWWQLHLQQSLPVCESNLHVPPKGYPSPGGEGEAGFGRRRRRPRVVSQKSLAPRGARKSLAAKHPPFPRHDTRAWAAGGAWNPPAAARRGGRG